MTNSKKLSEIIAHCTNGNQSDFARSLGVSQPAVASWLRRDSMDVYLIAEKYPQISAEWLIRGEGPMLRRAVQPTYLNINNQDAHNVHNGTGDINEGVTHNTYDINYGNNVTGNGNIIGNSGSISTGSSAGEIDELRKEVATLRKEKEELTQRCFTLTDKLTKLL